MASDETLPLPGPARPEGETLPLPSASPRPDADTLPADGLLVRPDADTLPAGGRPVRPDADTLPAGGRAVRPDADTLPAGGRAVRPEADTLAAMAEPAAPATQVVPGPRHALGAVYVDPLDDPPDLSAYSIRRLLGRGGTGSVYEAVEASTGTLVALKVLHPSLTTVPEARERFLRESRAATRLDHPNIVRVRAAGEENGVHFIAFDRVSGRPLVQLVGSSPIPVERVATWARALAHALAHAHGRGVLHRDVKPANVLVTAEWDVLLLDFGLARPADASRLTGTNDVLGTPGFMAPEQIYGRPSDERTDVYGLGATLYAMLEGRSPFPTMSLLVHRDELTRGRPPAMSGSVPAGLAAITLACLESVPDARYSTMEAVRDDLDRYLRGDRTRAEGRRTTARRWRWTALLLLGIAVMIAGAWAGRWKGREEPARTQAPPPVVTLDPEVELLGSGEARLYDIANRSVAELGKPRWSGMLPAKVRLPAGSWLVEGACRATFVTPCEGAVEVLSVRAPEGYVVVAVHGHRPFLMGRTEAGAKEYYDFLDTLDPDEAGARQPRDHRGRAIWWRREVTGEMALRGISWDDARTFARWKGARLPTMEEWTLACRGADARPYPWGRGVERAWARTTTNVSVSLEFRPMGAAPWNVSPFGAMDMFGNVAEWVEGGEGEGVRYLRGWGWTGDPDRWCEYELDTIAKGGPGLMAGVRLARDLE